jgi:hypothetical protein
MNAPSLVPSVTATSGRSSVDTYGLYGGGAFTGSVTAALAQVNNGPSTHATTLLSAWKNSSLTASALASYAGEVVVGMSDSMHSASRDGDDAHSETSESAPSLLSGKFTVEAIKNSRGVISVPKLSPFVQTLVPAALMQKKQLSSRGLVRQSSVSGSPLPIAQHVQVNNAVATSRLSMNNSIPGSPLSMGVPVETPTAIALATSVTAAPLIDPSYRLGVPLDAQRHSWATLAALCQCLPPSTNLYLGGIPSLMYLRPQPLKEEDRPWRQQLLSPESASTNSSSQSALFYDPFEAKRAKARNQNNSTAETIWIQNEIVHVEAAFSNPLAVPLQLHNLQVVLEGGNNTAYPVGVAVIPPETKLFLILLSFRPRESGTLKIIGASYSLFNASHFSRVDALGLGVSPFR